ncbi:hypothetical protein [Alkalilimnicola sp. S0819]|uniref:hypothetical protein n=1 Tax=Alkalilimnicola sp. S0819 TaxID=2613922 RepID=UPI001261408F|nr:hypothetical protein [Alkalilimnicola sp. S0819]KAB7628274.1 hypothetical protein F3N43_00775 [Alkalilimnicola sp. S0819]MPQ15170.1 hypothetical protein [Alkalilimnicola sp. S0819]
MKDVYIIAAAREVDGIGDLAPVGALEQALADQGLSIPEFVVDPLKAGWDTTTAPGHFRSGCAPLEALEAAARCIDEGKSTAALVSGEDLLRSEYAGRKAERAQAMAIYGEGCSLPEAYTRLSHAFMARQGWSEAQFLALAEALFENYQRTARRRGIPADPAPERYARVTALFRAVDCANPVVDFRGRLLLANAAQAEALGVPPEARIRLAGIGLGRVDEDGPENVEQLARYRHLERAYRRACEEAGVDFAREFLAGQALLEAYTCFPVSPLGLLSASGIATLPEQMQEVLAAREITVTGGMNLARAPWNNPALNALVVMVQELLAERAALGGVHGNGGLGYRQGFAILQRA